MNVRRLYCAVFALIAASGLLLGESTTWKAVISCGLQDYPLPTHIDTVTLPSGITESLSLATHSPMGVAITPDGTKAVVANTSNYTGGGTDVVLVLDLTQPITTIIGSPIEFSQGSSLQGTAITPDGTTAIVVDTGLNTINFIDISLIQLVDSLPVPYPTGSIAITTDGTQALVPCEAGIVVVDVATKVITATISTSTSATGIAVTPDGTLALAVCGSSVAVIDLSSSSIIATIPLPLSGVSIAISSDGTLALVTYPYGSVIAID